MPTLTKTKDIPILLSSTPMIPVLGALPTAHGAEQADSRVGWGGCSLAWGRWGATEGVSFSEAQNLPECGRAELRGLPGSRWGWIRLMEVGQGQLSLVSLDGTGSLGER